MKILAFVTLVITSSVSSVSAENYVCTSDKAVAFVYHNGWEGKSGSYTFEKFAIDTGGAGDIFKAFGSGEKPFYFNDDCRVTDYGVICDSIFGQFRFDKKSLRYLRSYIWGYWEGIDNNDSNPIIVIGSCAPF